MLIRAAEALVIMALSISKKIRARLLITVARLLRIPVAIHQSFFNVSASNYPRCSDISRRAERIPFETD
jgi:hypothetical protein